MKKNFGIYSIIWAICLAVFNVIVFVTPNEIGGVSKFSGSFWVGYIFITVAFLGQLICTFIAFKTENLKKLFYNIPLLSISYGGLVVMLIAGSIFMAIPMLPEWIGIIICAVVLAFNVIAVVKASATADIVVGIDEKIKAQTFYIKSLSVDSQALISSAKTYELRSEAKKVYEAIRYSDPMSNSLLFDTETQIQNVFNEFSSAIKENDLEKAKENVSKILELIEIRNQKCKLLK